MEFLKKMKSREMVEMSLKTIMGILVGLILIILMEGMIYSIYMNKINEKNGSSSYINNNCIAYCEEIDDDFYKVYLHDTEYNTWTVLESETQEQIESGNYAKIVYHTPTPFDVSITGTHYIVMTIFISIIAGVYAWRFYKLNKEYKSFEKKYQKTGKIFA